MRLNFLYENLTAPILSPFLLLQWSKFSFPPLQFILPLMLWILLLLPGTLFPVTFHPIQVTFLPPSHSWNYPRETWALLQWNTQETFLAMILFQPFTGHGLAGALPTTPLCLAVLPVPSPAVPHQSHGGHPFCYSSNKYWLPCGPALNAHPTLHSLPGEFYSHTSLLYT